MSKLNQKTISVSLESNNVQVLTPHEMLDIRCCKLEKENEELKRELEHLKDMCEMLLGDDKFERV